METKNYNLSQDSTLGGLNPSTSLIPSQKAVKEYIDSQSVFFDIMLVHESEPGPGPGPKDTKAGGDYEYFVSCDHTVAEIIEAHLAGKTIRITESGSSDDSGGGGDDGGDDGGKKGGSKAFGDANIYEHVIAEVDDYYQDEYTYDADDGGGDDGGKGNLTKGVLRTVTVTVREDAIQLHVDRGTDIGESYYSLREYSETAEGETYSGSEYSKRVEYRFDGNYDDLYNKPDTPDFTLLSGVLESLEINGTIQSPYRILTTGEWNYLRYWRESTFETRDSNNNSCFETRYVKATVNGVCGVILFPDSGNVTAGVVPVNGPNLASTTYASNVYTENSWDVYFKPVGCVFLPVTGMRKGTTVSTLDEGYYWSSTNNSYQGADAEHFTNSDWLNGYRPHKYIGCAVRPVKISLSNEGKFTVRDGNSFSKVDIADSNLQYHCKNKEWRFALNPWDSVGNGNANVAENYDGWIDLFGFGTSGWNNGYETYQPWYTVVDDGHYANYSLTGDYAYGDWSVFAFIKQLQPIAFEGDYYISSGSGDNTTNITFGFTKEYQVVNVTGSSQTFNFAVNNAGTNYLLVKNTGSNSCTIAIGVQSGTNFIDIIKPSGTITVAAGKAIELSLLSILNGTELVLTVSPELEINSLT